MKLWYSIVAVENITRTCITETIYTEDAIRLSDDESMGILVFDTRYPDSMKGIILYDQAWMNQYLTENEQYW